MKGTCANSTTCRHTNYYISILSPAIMDLCEIVYNLIKTHRNKISKLHFHHAFVSFERQTKSRTNDCAFTQRCISYSFFSKFFYKTFCDLKCTTILSNILAHRSEERRVGKECRSRWMSYHQK